MNLKTLCVGLNTNKQMVGEYEDVSNKHAEGADRSITSSNHLSFKTYFSACSQANPARFDKMITNK